MDFELDVGQRAWLTEVREFRHDNVTAELRAELVQHDLEFPDVEVARFRRKIGEKRWLGLVIRSGTRLEATDLEEFLAAQPDLSPKAWPRYVRTRR
jgi:hypothetical protein